MGSTRPSCINKSIVKDGEEVYQLQKGILGRCLIFNNVNFDYLNKRNGSDADAERFKTVFEDLGFIVVLEEDKTAQEMKQTIDRVAKDKDNEDSSAFVLIVLTHGDEGLLCGTDYNPYKKEFTPYLSYKEIVNLLSNINCKVLKGKPKLCFFQACNGLKKSELVEDSSLPTLKTKRERLPEVSDILLSFAAQEGYTTIRKLDNGGVFSYHLAHVLMKYAWSLDILEMLCIVERRIRDEELRLSVDLCLSTSLKLFGWSKKFYFNPDHGVNRTIETDSPHQHIEMEVPLSPSITEVTEEKSLCVLGGAQPPECLSEDGLSWTVMEASGLDTEQQAIANCKGTVYVCNEFCISKWNPKERRTTLVTKFPQPRKLYAHAMTGNKIFIMGGEVNSKATSSFMTFDCRTGNWTETEGQMIRTCSGRTATTFQGKIYATAGREHQCFSKLEILNPQDGTWTKAKGNMNTPRCGQAIVACDKHLWIFGGREQRSKGDTFICGDVERFDFVKEKWERILPLPTPRTNLSVAYFGKKFYAIGGLDEQGNALDLVEIYDPQTNTWNQGPRLNCARSGHSNIALPYLG